MLKSTTKQKCIVGRMGPKPRVSHWKQYAYTSSVRREGEGQLFHWIRGLASYSGIKWKQALKNSSKKVVALSLYTGSLDSENPSVSSRPFAFSTLVCHCYGLQVLSVD